MKSIREISIEEAEEFLRMIGYPWGKKIDNIEDSSIVENPVYVIPNKIILNKMFKAKGGSKIKKLYNGDITQHNNDRSAADAALCTTLAFWTSKNKVQMEEIWLESPLGKREKTQKRKDYRDRTIDAVCNLVVSVYKGGSSGSIVKANAPIKPEFLQEIKLDGENSRSGKPHKNIPNIRKIISADSYLANSFRYNSFSDLFETNVDNGSDWIPLETRHIIEISDYIQNTYTHFENLVQSVVDQAIVVYAQEKRVNPPKDLITKWF